MKAFAFERKDLVSAYLTTEIEDERLLVNLYEDLIEALEKEKKDHEDYVKY